MRDPGHGYRVRSRVQIQVQIQGPRPGSTSKNLISEIDRSKDWIGPPARMTGFPYKPVINSVIYLGHTAKQH